jgi:hypothetical protein
MGRQSQNSFKGAVGNVIYYEFRGIPCVRARPGSIKQTKNTKESAKRFGMASSMAASLRYGLESFTPIDKKREIQSRLVKVILQWLQHDPPGTKGLFNGLSLIKGFEFNEDSPLSALLKVAIEVSWNDKERIIIKIPALVPSRDISAPAKTQKVFWKIFAVRCTIDYPSVRQDVESSEFEMPYNDNAINARLIELPVALQKNQLGIVAISLAYSVKKIGWKPSSAWLPAAIVDAAYYK